jgi:hypothetical protein
LLHEGRDAEAEVWLSRSVAHRSEIGMQWYQTLPWERQGEVLLYTSGYLLDLARSETNKEFALAVEWCGRTGRIDMICLSRALAHHEDCTLGDPSSAVLKVQDFDHSAVCRACRSRELYGHPLPEKPGAWPRVKET